jgi:integrase
LPLTDAAVRSAKPREKSYKLSDAKGLHLLVQVSGSRLWRYKYRINGAENLFAIGKYPDVSLQQAREARDAAAKLVKLGKHPSHARQAGRLAAAEASANTFRAVAEEWIAKREKGTKTKEPWSAYYAKQVKTVLANDVYGKIGILPIRDVTSAHLDAIVKKVEERAPSIASLILLWSSQVFKYAIRNRLADSDPTLSLRGEVSRPATKHKTALKKSELPKFLKALRQSGGVEQVRIAIELLMLTFVRPSELRCASWAEFDFDHAEWRIPAARMKMKREHVVPLSKQAISLLGQLKELSGDRPLLFPNVRNPQKPMSATTMNRRIERMGYAGKFSAHGFRATASTMLNEHGYRPDVIERQLAHKDVSEVRASYNFASYMPERKEMMQWWADQIDTYRKTRPEGAQGASSPESDGMGN